MKREKLSIKGEGEGESEPNTKQKSTKRDSNETEGSVIHPVTFRVKE